MSSNSDLFGPEDFENLIAAVDSLDFPTDEQETASPILKQVDSSPDASAATDTGKATFEIDDNPVETSTSLSFESEEELRFDDFNGLPEEYDESILEDELDAVAPYSPTLDFAEEAEPVTNQHSEPQVAKFSVDDPFQNAAPDSDSSATETSAEFASIEEEDDLIDMYASFIEETEDNPALQQTTTTELTLESTEDEFSEFASLSNSDESSSEKLDLFGDDGFEEFDGVAAANQISEIWNEEQQVTTVQNQPAEKETPVSREMHAEAQPLMTSMAKTQQAANKLKAHLESLANRQQTNNSVAVPEPLAPETEIEPPKTAAVPEPLALEKETEQPKVDAGVDTQDDLESFFDQPPEPGPADQLLTDSFPLNDSAHEELDGFFDELPTEEPVTHVAKVRTEPEKSKITTVNAPVGDLADGPIELSRKKADVSDNLMAAFLESTLSSKKKIRFFSLHTFATKFPRAYFASCFLLALVGFAYILAIPALLTIAMINGFEMLNSPFTNNMVMLLSALFGISMFLFMSIYKLMDLKFVGPGGITLNQENAANLIDKLQTLSNEQKIPKIHEIILTRRHELNLIKIPRFGLPVWSRNVLAIGYPLLQTLPADYFDVALSRRLAQYNKRKNVLHNWLSFMRRSWTIYAVSLKERKGIIDLLHYCFFAPYASLYRNFAVYISQKDELLADEKALELCNDRDLIKTAQTLRITRAMLIQYFWPKLNEDLHVNTAAPHYVKPYSQLPAVLNTLLNTKQVDAWFIRLGQELTNPGDAEAPFALRMATLGQRKVALPEAFDTNAAQSYFDDQYEKMTDLMDTLWADEVQKELFENNIHNGQLDADLPCHLAIEPA